MPIEVWCAPSIHLATIDEDVVVLDLAADRYQCLIGGARVLTPAPDGRVTIEDPDIARQLSALGLVKDTPLAAPRLPPVTPTGDVAEGADASALEVLRAGVSLAAAVPRFRRCALPALLRLEIPMRDPSRADAARLATLVGAARRARPWVPFEGACLQRSFQLRRYLAGRGVATDWVFGVRTWPFAAHCWLQIGALVVGDRMERVRRFTPLLRT